jgi:hypothetical protein
VSSSIFTIWTQEILVTHARTWKFEFCCLNLKLWNKVILDIHTSIGRPPASLDKDCLEPPASKCSLPVLLNEVDLLAAEEVIEAGDAALSTVQEMKNCWLRDLRWSSTNIRRTIAFSAKAAERLPAFSTCGFVSLGIKPSAATPAAAAATPSVCCGKNQNNKKQASYANLKKLVAWYVM